MSFLLFICCAWYDYLVLISQFIWFSFANLSTQFWIRTLLFRLALASDSGTCSIRMVRCSFQSSSSATISTWTAPYFSWSWVFRPCPSSRREAIWHWSSWADWFRNMDSICCWRSDHIRCIQCSRTRSYFYLAAWQTQIQQALHI